MKNFVKSNLIIVSLFMPFIANAFPNFNSFNGFFKYILPCYSSQIANLTIQNDFSCSQKVFINVGVKNSNDSLMDTSVTIKKNSNKAVSFANISIPSNNSVEIVITLYYNDNTSYKTETIFLTPTNGIATLTGNIVISLD